MKFGRRVFVVSMLIDKHHKSFLEAGARWDEKLQVYVRRDGSHGQVGHLANIYNRKATANTGQPQSSASPHQPGD